MTPHPSTPKLLAHLKKKNQANNILTYKYSTKSTKIIPNVLLYMTFYKSRGVSVPQTQGGREGSDLLE